MAKSPDAFRTISEVADWLGIPAHVLRFWESKFTQVRPVKRAGGRRYYRPNDMLLLGGIKQLLHEDGLTIKGVQKVLREEGMSHVAALSVPLDELTQSQLEDAPTAGFAEIVEEPAEEKGVVLNFETAPAKVEADPEPEQSADPEPAPEPETSVTAAKADEVETAPKAPLEAAEPETVVTDSADPEPAQSAPEAPEDAPIAAQTDAREAAESSTDKTTADLPAFLRRPMPGQPAPTDNAPAEASPPASAPEPPTAAPEAPPEPAKPKPRIIDMPALTPEHEIAAAPATLSAVYRTRHLSIEQAKQIAPLLNKLSVLRDSMAAPRKGASNTGSSSGSTSGSNT